MIRIYSDPDAAKYVWGMGWHWCLGLEGCWRGVFVVFPVVESIHVQMILMFPPFFAATASQGSFQVQISISNSLPLKFLNSH